MELYEIYMDTGKLTGKKFRTRRLSARTLGGVCVSNVPLMHSGPVGFMGLIPDITIGPFEQEIFFFGGGGDLNPLQMSHLQITHS